MKERLKNGSREIYTGYYEYQRKEFKQRLFIFLNNVREDSIINVNIYKKLEEIP